MIGKKMNRISIISMLALIFLVIVMPRFLNSYYLSIFTTIAIYGIVAQGLNILLGFTGQISIGHAGFMAIGAYMTGYVVKHWTQQIIVVWILVILSTALIGFALGYICLRLKGPYLALATIGFMIIIQRIAMAWTPVTGGPDGILAIKPLAIGSFLFDSKPLQYFLSMATLAIVLVAMKFLRESRVGRAMLAVRDDELGSRLSGVNATQYKVMAFVISAVLGGISGSLFAVTTRAIFPNFFGITLSSQLMMIQVIGGIGSIPGVTIGTLLVVGSFEMFRGLREYQMILFCVLVILSILYMPQGIIGLINKGLRKFFGVSVGKAITVPGKITRAISLKPKDIQKQNEL